MALKGPGHGIDLGLESPDLGVGLEGPGLGLIVSLRVLALTT